MAQTLHRPNHPELRDRLKITHEDGRLGLHLDPSLIPGGGDVLDRLREASAPEALKEIGHEPVARILASLREEHEHLEGRPWMGEQRRIVGATIAALGWHLREQGVGHVIPNSEQVDALIEAHGGEAALSTMTLHALEQPGMVRSLAGGAAKALRRMMPAARSVRSSLSFVGEIERDEFVQRSSYYGGGRRERHPPTEREQALVSLLEGVGGREAARTAGVIRGFFDERRPEYSMDPWMRDNRLGTLDGVLIPGMQWHLANRGQSGGRLDEYVRDLLAFYVQDPNHSTLLGIPAGIRFDLDVMRLASERIAGRGTTSYYDYGTQGMPHYLSLCHSREDVGRLFDAAEGRSLGHDDTFLGRASSLDDLISRLNVDGEFSRGVYDRLSPQVPPEERREFEETLRGLNGIYRQYDTWPNRERKIDGVQSWGDLKAIAPLILTLQGSQEKPQTLSGMADRIAALTPPQLEVFENAITAGYFKDVQEGLYNLAQADRDEGLLSGICGAQSGGRAAGTIREALAMIDRFSGDYSGVAGVAREVIDEEVRGGRPDLASASAALERVYEITGSYSHDDRTPLRNGNVVRLGYRAFREHGTHDVFEEAFGRLTGLCGRQSQTWQIGSSFESNAVDYLTAFVGNPQAAEVEGRITAYLERIAANSGRSPVGWTIQNAVQGGVSYGREPGILAGAVRAYNASGRDLGVLDGLLGEIGNPTEFGYRDRGGYDNNSFGEYCGLASTVIGALGGSPETVPILQHVRGNVQAFASRFQYSVIQVPRPEHAGLTDSLDLIGAACEVVRGDSYQKNKGDDSSVGAAHEVVKRGGSADDFRFITGAASHLIAQGESAGGGYTSYAARTGITTILHHAGDAAEARRCLEWLAACEGGLIFLGEGGWLQQQRLNLLSTGFFPNMMESFGGDVEGFLNFGESLVELNSRVGYNAMLPLLETCSRKVGFIGERGEMTAGKEQVLALATLVSDLLTETISMESENLGGEFLSSFSTAVKSGGERVTSIDDLKALGDRMLAVPRMLRDAGHEELAPYVMLSLPDKLCNMIPATSGRDMEALTLEVGRGIASVADECVRLGLSAEDKGAVVRSIADFPHLLSEPGRVAEVGKRIAAVQADAVRRGHGELSSTVRAAVAASHGGMQSPDEIEALGLAVLDVADSAVSEGLEGHSYSILHKTGVIAGRFVGQADARDIGRQVIAVRKRTLGESLRPESRLVYDNLEKIPFTRPGSVERIGSEWVDFMESDAHFHQLFDAGGPLHANSYQVFEEIFRNAEPVVRAKQVEGIFTRKVPYWQQLVYWAETRIRSQLEEATSEYPVDRVGPSQVARLHELGTLGRWTAGDVEPDESGRVKFNSLNASGKRLALRRYVRDVIQTSRSDEAKQAADERNRRLAAESGELSLSAGAYLHGSAFDHVPSVLLNGNLPTELLGEACGTDSYPFHVDFGRITEADVQGAEGHTRRILEGSISHGYGLGGSQGAEGQLYYVYDRRHALWESGVDQTTGNEKHSLILGGMPATEVTAIVLRNPDVTAESVKRAVMENGCYIPVYDLDGKLIFTPQEYDTRRADLNLAVPVGVWDTSMKVGDAMGSNPGGTYVVPDRTGPVRHYVKTAGAEAADCLWNEQLADNVYRFMGIAVPETQVVKVEGSYGHASRMLEGAAAGHGPDLKDGFVVDCLLANWDVIAHGGNTMTAGGVTYRTDNGGALLFRARGERKGDGGTTPFRREVGELVSMRHGYPGLSDEDVSGQAEHMRDRLTDDAIDALVDGVRLSLADRETLKATLRARRDYIVGAVLGGEAREATPEQSALQGETLRILQAGGLVGNPRLGEIIPDWARISGAGGYQHNGAHLGEHTQDVVRVVQTLPEWEALDAGERRLALAAAFFHDFGKPTGRVGEEVPREFGHESESIIRAASHMSRLGFTPAEISTVSRVIQYDGVVSDISRRKLRNENGEPIPEEEYPAHLAEVKAIGETALRILRAVNKADVIGTVGEQGFGTIQREYDRIFGELQA